MYKNESVSKHQLPYFFLEYVTNLNATIIEHNIFNRFKGSLTFLTSGILFSSEGGSDEGGDCDVC